MNPTTSLIAISLPLRRSLCALLLAVSAQRCAASQETPQAPVESTPTAQADTPQETTQPPPTEAREKQKNASVSIEIDLSAQKAWVLQDGKRVYETPISSGRTGHETPSGDFSVLEKDLDHRSSLYGKIVDSKGRVLISDGDSDMAIPAGGQFVRAPMKHFMRFDGATGMHAGRLPGYPASHGCVRLPPSKAVLFYNVAEVGTPVRVFGKAPRTGPPNRSRKVIEATPVPATPAPTKGGWLTRLFSKPNSSAAPTPAVR